MVTEASRNEHALIQYFLLELQPGMKILCQRNVLYVPDWMFRKQSRT